MLSKIVVHTDGLPALLGEQVTKLDQDRRVDAFVLNRDVPLEKASE